VRPAVHQAHVLGMLNCDKQVSHIFSYTLYKIVPFHNHFTR